MKEWLTAREFADLRLKQFPTTIKGILDLAIREGWDADDMRSRRRAGRGGGREYHLSLLPLVAQMDYQKRTLRIGAPTMPPAANDEPARDATEARSGRAQLQRDARLAILAAFRDFRRGQNINKAGSVGFFVTKYNGRTLAIDPWVTALVKSISPRSLLRWEAEAKADANRLAVDKAAARKGKGVIETANGGALRLFVLGLIAEQPHLAAREVRRQCRHRFGDMVEFVAAAGEVKTIEMPPVRTFQHALKALKECNKVVLTELTNPDLFRSTMKLSGTGTLRHIDRPNMLWQIDASPVDAKCTDGRKAIYACIDIATRRTIWFVSDTPRASAVALLIRKAINEWGVPDVIATDNGSDFVARDTKRLFASLGIEPDVCDAYAPEQKGHVERVIRTFQHTVAPLLPGYVGHSVADRKAIEGRKSFANRLGQDEKEAFGVEISGIELQGYVDRWAAEDYAHTPHAGLKGRTPFQVAAAAGGTIRRVDERALDVLLMPVAGKDGQRTVTKFGIRIDHYHYLNATLLPGETVFVRRDPNDLGRVIAFSGEDGGFLGEAICAELAGIHPATFVKAQKELQAEIIARAAQEIEAQRREIRKGPRLIERALEVARRDMPNVVALPRPTVEHTTPQIAAALDAVRPAEASRSLEGRAAEIHAALVAELAPAAAPAPEALPVATVSRLPETPHQRFRRALDMEAKRARGEPLGEDDALWLGGYMAGPEYRALKAVHDDFGDAMRL